MLYDGEPLGAPHIGPLSMVRGIEEEKGLQKTLLLWRVESFVQG